MKTEMWAQALSVFDRRNHFTAAVWMELVFNDLRLLSSTTGALKNLYVVRELGSRQQQLDLKSGSQHLLLLLIMNEAGIR